MLKRPFLAYVGMEFSVSLSSKDASKEILYEYSSKIPQTTNAFLDYKRQKNFYKLCLSSNNGIIPIDLLNFRINMVQYIHNSEERISRNVSSKPEESYFLVHFAEETELFIENYIENSYIQYPLLRQINVLKEEILKRPSLKALRRDLTREMGLNNLALNNNYYKSFLLIGKKGSGKKEVLSLICRKFGLNYFETDAKKISSLKSLEKNLKKALNLRPVLVNIRNFKALLHVVANKVYQDPQKSFVLFIKDFLEDFRILTKSSVDQMPCHLLFSCDKFDDLDPFDNEIKNLFDFLIKTKDFNLEELENLWETCLKIENMPIISELATISKGIPWKNIIKIYEKNKSETGTSFSYENLKKALENFKKNKEFDNPSIPNVKWEDVGGLIEAKNDIIDTIMLPQQYPQIFNEFMRPRTGLLFYGPPGKSLITNLF